MPPRSTTITVSLVRPDDSMVPSGCCPTPGGWCSGCPLLNAVNNTTIAATVSYDAAARTATVTPNSPLDPATVYTMIVSAGGVKDLAGNALATDTWTSFYTSNQPAPVHVVVLGLGRLPRRFVDSGDNQAVELGLKFTADTDGLDHRRAVLQERGQHRHAHGQSVDQRRPAAGHRHVHQRDRQRLAASQLLHAGSHHGRHDLCRFVPHQQRPLLGEP